MPHAVEHLLGKKQIEANSVGRDFCLLLLLVAWLLVIILSSLLAICQTAIAT